MALAAAAEESPDLAAAAHDAWPLVIRQGLCILERSDHSDQTRSDEQERAQVFSALLPNQTPETLFMYREIPDGPLSWINPESWTTEVDHWVAPLRKQPVPTEPTVSGRKMFYRPPRFDGFFGSIDALISMLCECQSRNRPGLGSAG